MSSILKFFIKRVCILYFVLIVACFFCKYERIYIIVALTLSVLFSLLRFWLLESMINYMGNNGKKKLAIIVTIVMYILGLIIIGITAILALNFGAYTFIAALVGSLSIVIITIINGITEALGITKNGFGEKVI